MTVLLTVSKINRNSMTAGNDAVMTRIRIFRYRQRNTIINTDSRARARARARLYLIRITLPRWEILLHYRVQDPPENGDIRENDEVLSNLAATCEALSELGIPRIHLTWAMADGGGERKKRRKKLWDKLGKICLKVRKANRVPRMKRRPVYFSRRIYRNRAMTLTLTRARPNER